MTRVYLVRHCQTTGQEPEAPLTAAGEAQARRLAEFLSPLGIERIVSSPYARAVGSVLPLAERLGLPVERDERLKERVFSTVPLPDWMERYRASFDDLDVAQEGGETSREAMARGAAAVEEVLADGRVAAVVSHGNLLTLIRRHFDGRGGFEEWRTLTNPDVFCLTREASGHKLERVWRE